MKKTILRYSAISSGILAFQILLTFILLKDVKMNMAVGMAIGFTSMILAFGLSYFAILHFKDHYNNGTVSFLQGVKIALAITAIGSTAYVLSWLVIYYNFIPDFYEKYAAIQAEQMRKAGQSEAAIKKTYDTMAGYGKNPLALIGITYMEVFWVGLIISPIAAGIASYKSKRSTTA
jgi:hypothetical protein